MDILSHTKEDWETRLAGIGQPKFRAKQILDWIYKKRVRSWEEMTNLPADLRAELTAGRPIGTLRAIRESGSHDSTRKFLFELSDGQLIESVLIPASPALYSESSDRKTVCLSSQVGCAYGCRFCASGLDGWKRNLTPGEIVDQFLQVEACSGEKINNIVFMGMGEPMANFDHLMRSIEILNASWGPGLGARHMTISTSGLAPQIRQFAIQPLQVRLAVSLHAATDDIRSAIMPINKKYPLDELMDACLEYTRHKKQRITFEYILIKEFNDRPEHARQLVQRIRPIDSIVNLIPYNMIDGLEWERPEEDRQEAFLAILRNAGLVVTLRREKGIDIAAACGQLRLQALNAKNAANAAI